ncbi:MAG: DUF4132 domain-containing protein [Oscillospiraceae bacterium]|nr:DUF4132 domain-containing protein [Oscillospiraceae bacterium]
MMYVNKAVPGEQFARLTQALRDIGVSEDTLRIMRDYLDLEKKRDNSLLDQITPMDLSHVVYYTYPAVQALEKAILKEINRDNSTELSERYILFCYAVADAYCMKLRVPGSSDEIEKRMQNAFRTRYGDQAEARTLAVFVTHHAENARGWYHYHLRNFLNFQNKNQKNPALFHQAIAYTPGLNPKLYLILFALHALNLRSENLILKPSARLKGEILGTLDQLSQQQTNSNEMKTIQLLAIAEASCLDQNYLQRLDREVQSNPALIYEIADIAITVFQEDTEHVLYQLNLLSVTVQNYINLIANRTHLEKSRDKLLKQLAKKFPTEFRTQILNESDSTLAERMHKIYVSAHPGNAIPCDIQSAAKNRCIRIYTENTDDANDKTAIQNYLLGKSSTEEFFQILPNLKKAYFRTTGIHYIQAYGMDDFAERCICYCALLCDNAKYSMQSVIGFRIEEHEKEYIKILKKHQIPLESVLNVFADYVADYYTESAKTKAKDRIVRACASYMDEVVAVDLKQLTADARCLYVQMLGENGKYKYLSELFAMTTDSSKNVRNLLINYLPKPADPCNEKILALLQAKKIAQREVAIGLLEKKFPDCWKEHVQKAFETEKSDKLKVRLGALLGAEIPEEVKQATSENLVDSLTKGNKGKKTDWLFKNAYTPVYFKNHSKNSEVPEKYLQAIVNCYAGMSVGNYERSPQADQLAADLISTDLERFAQEVFSRWLDQGAEAKTKWVLYFTAIHGGFDAIQTIQHYIKDWSEHSRGAIAAEAVRAIAYNDSSQALMLVDTMARKFKNKQVRSAANAALQQAANVLGITREELADKIVPDLGFDENLCRVFDYGTRQFQVYLTPALELEIYEGEKKFKNLPKPGTKDDPEKSAQAVKDFKDMKKQMKAAIQSQKSRLEYALLCDRKWTVQAWKDLFIQKPVMHCFAIGLIWGVYQDQQLIQTFRYTEDGSFNTSDSDAYEFPEDTQSIRIGLVHPVELEQDVISEWLEQLADYEIMQPFAQLSRKVYKLLPEEAGKTAVQRFSGNEMGNVTLAGKMLKAEWSKGDAQDGGAFYEFTKTDIAGQKKSEDGKMQYTGYYAELAFEGMYIQISYEDNQNVTIGELKFWSLDQPIHAKNPLKLEQVSPRYFSEIILQLTTIFGEEVTEHAEN